MSKPGEKESSEYVPDGSIRLAGRGPDSRGRLNGDGSKSTIVAERPIYLEDPEALLRALQEIAVIEPCPCPCCGDHESVMIARRAIGAK